MALSNGYATFQNFIDYNSFNYSISILSMDNSMNVRPIYVNTSGPYQRPVTLVYRPSMSEKTIELYIYNDIGDHTILYLENPFYGTFSAPQVERTWNGTEVSYAVTNTNNYPVYFYTNDKPMSMLGPGETSIPLKEVYNSSASNFILKIAFQACGVYSTPFSETIVNNDAQIENDVSKVLYYKNIKPIFSSSDRSSSTGFTDTNRLKTLLLRWGFSEVDVSQVTEWKISALNQYISDGPRLEWKGKLFVKDSKLHLLKCRNKDNTKKQTCYDLRLGEFILLNTHASGYNSADWKYIHITELGFAMRATCAFLKKDAEYFTSSNFMQSESKDIYIDDRIYTTGTKINNMTNWPYANYYVPGYGVKGKSLNAAGYLFESSGTEEDYRYINNINYTNGTTTFFTSKPQKFNFTKTPLIDYEWIYEDFTYAYDDLSTCRKGFPSIKLKYDKTNKKLIIRGYSGATEYGDEVNNISFDAEKDKCFLFFRNPTDDVDVGTIEYSQQLSPNNIVDISVKVTTSIPKDKDSFIINLKPIQYKVLDFTNTTHYIFASYGYYFENIGSSYVFENLPSVSVITKNTKAQGYWENFLNDFIVKNVENYSTKSTGKFEYKEDKGFYFSSWSGPESFGYTLKTSNLQTLKGINKTSFNNSFNCSFEQTEFDEDAGTVIGVYTWTFLTTGLKYIYTSNKKYNGFFNSGQYKANCTGRADTTGVLDGYWYSFRYLEDGSEIGSTTDGMPTAIVIQAQHTGGCSVGIDMKYSSPTALAILVLRTNKNTTITPDPNDDISTGGSITPGGNPNDPLQPTDKPVIDQIP